MLKNGPLEWELIETKKIHQNDMITLYEDVLNLDGEEKIYTRCKRNDYSTIVPFISDTEVLVIKSYRHLVDSTHIEVPSGYINDKEDPKSAVKRELLEETGFVAKKIYSLGKYTLDYSMFEQYGHVFVGYQLEKIKKQDLEKMEKIEVKIMSIDNLKRFLEQGKILNAASIIALYRALNFHQKKVDKEKFKKSNHLINQWH
ncbi:MAG: hypothetical protein DA328_05920 [Nitrososphaeraceae archaeon]|nr:hypothetical protein [Nitrososphaeraceae archaeon]